MIYLLYHGITSSHYLQTPNRELGAGYYDVTVNAFKEQMGDLVQSNIKAVITFDDGEMNNFDLAFPILKQQSLKGHFFIITDHIGKDGYMHIRHLKEIVQSGMFVGSHGLSHKPLSVMPFNQIRIELTQSKRILEDCLGVAVTSFSVPMNSYNDQIIDLVASIGYTEIFVYQKLWSIKNPLCIPRVVVRNGWDLKRFQLALDKRIPFNEVLFDVIKDSSKYLLKDAGYKTVRKRMIEFTGKFKFLF